MCHLSFGLWMDDVFIDEGLEGEGEGEDDVGVGLTLNPGGSADRLSSGWFRNPTRSWTHRQQKAWCRILPAAWVACFSGHTYVKSCADRGWKVTLPK